MSDIPSFTAVVTRSGLSLSLRPVTRDDGHLLRDFFDKVTPEDLRFCFLTAILRVSDDQIASMNGVDHKQKEALQVFVDDGEFGRSHTLTPVTHAHLCCRLPL